jgi:hypothetical protein
MMVMMMDRRNIHALSGFETQGISVQAVKAYA